MNQNDQMCTGFRSLTEAAAAEMSRPRRVGDVVRLNSGGPKMTVVDVYPSEWLRCIWHTEAGECREGRFDGRCVRVA